MSRRTSIVVMTNEARVLKQLREKAGFSMREAAAQIGISSSLISQIENGRENFPNGEKLQRFLNLYNIGIKSFKNKVLTYRDEETDIDRICYLLPKLRSDHVKMVRALIEQMIKTN